MTTDEENLIVTNVNLAYDIAWKYHRRFSKYAEFEDFKSEALVGLTKAAKTFNPQFNLAFSTYAYKVIQNEILVFLRQFRKNQADSIYAETTENLEIIDSLSSEDNIEENVFDECCLKELYECINTLPERLKVIINYRLHGMTMIEIGKHMNLSQSAISKEYHKAINRLKMKLKYWR